MVRLDRAQASARATPEHERRREPRESEQRHEPGELPASALQERPGQRLARRLGEVGVTANETMPPSHASHS